MEVNPRLNEQRISALINKVPQVTLMFWVIKILATTVGETGGDAFSMTLKFGYAVSSLIFLGLGSSIFFGCWRLPVITVSAN